MLAIFQDREVLAHCSAEGGDDPHSGDHHALHVIPPSTPMTCPEIYAAWSLARKLTSAATSSGCPTRPAGMWGSICSRGASFIMSVSINPGATAFTVTFRFANSLASAFVAPIKPALAAE